MNDQINFFPKRKKSLHYFNEGKNLYKKTLKNFQKIISLKIWTGLKSLF